MERVLVCTLMLTTFYSCTAAKECKIAVTNSTCPNGQYFDSTKQVCSNCKICKVGHGVRCGCRFASNTECEICPKGTFSKFQNGNSYCIQCSKCKLTHYIKYICNRTDDTGCALKPKTFRESHDTSVYIVIIVVISILVLVVVGLLAFFIMSWRRERVARHAAEVRRAGNISNASEAPCLEGSSLSDFEESKWKKERFKFAGSSCSSLDESRWRQRDDMDSIQSSLLSSEHQSGMERSSRRTLQNGDVLVSSLPATVYQDLGKLLNPTKSYRDWQTLAGKFGKTQMDIENYKVYNNRDYTEQLLHTWCTEKPFATLFELLSILVEMGREDAAAVLYKHDSQMLGKQKRVETPV